MEDGYTHGINKLKKSSTKVSAPPGGRSQLNLFGGEEAVEHKVSHCQYARSKSSVFGESADTFNTPNRAASAGPAAEIADEENNNNVEKEEEDDEIKTTQEVPITPTSMSSPWGTYEPTTPTTPNSTSNNNNNSSINSRHSGKKNEQSFTDTPHRSSTRVMAPPGGACSNIFG